jgi:hypothetical protein
MTKTFNSAVELFKAGRRDEAWELAKQDEGINADVTQEQFTAYVSSLIENHRATEAANAAPHRD